MGSKPPRSTNMPRYAGRAVLTVCLLPFIVSVPTALKESRLDALAKGTAFLLIQLVELASMNIVVTMAEDLRAIRERLDG